MRSKFIIALATPLAGLAITLALTCGAAAVNPPPSKGGARGGIEQVAKAGLTSDTTVANPSPYPSLQGRGINAAACRIHNRLPDGATNVGSGTLIDVTAGNERGLVLTCAHLFAEGTGKLLVEFPDGQTHGALLVEADHNADLAALEIATPTTQPAPLNLQINAATTLRACGFGGSGQYRCAQGRILGYSERPGQVSMRIAGPVRSGDSGGGVFDAEGRLCGVVWGESGGVTYASTGRPLAAFLERVLGRRREVAAMQPHAATVICPNGRCPLVRPAPIAPAPAGRSPAASAAPPLASSPLAALASPSRSCDCEGKFEAIVARLDALQSVNYDAPPITPPSTFSSAARTAAALAMTALGVSGPMGWGIIAATTLGGWFLGRRMHRRRKRRLSSIQHQASSNAAVEATAAADAAFPIERDDREARELLRLSQLEGRDPLQDAVAGRLALDRLDAIAESDADSPQATWADRLRRDLREKFNEIAPTKFQLGK